MYSLFRKEIKTFLGSLIGYLAVLVFLLVTGLFLWVFPGAYNIPDNGYATLEPLFSLAPWLYLFLVPAITMRFFADEKRSGTIEILLTHPISDFKLVLAKFFAGMVLVIFSLLPTLLYFLSVYLLGEPVGSIDVGATWGSFIGLFLLAAVYVAIGVFASSFTDNQIVSFILAMAMSFIFYLGFDFVGSAGVSYLFEELLSWMSINNHYLSISRGVVDMRDIIYYFGITLLFLYLTSVFLRISNWKKGRIKRNVAVFVVLLIVVFVVSSNFLFRLDLTADKRYSLSDVSKEIVSGIEQPVEVEFFLIGELEPGLRKLQQEVLEKIAVLNVFSPKPIRIKFTDPYSIGDVEKRQNLIDEIAGKGVTPTSFRKQTNEGVSTRTIFPGALVSMGGKEMAVNFLKSNPDFSAEANFNHSVESVEFELINVFRKLMRTKKSTLAFLDGNQELNQYQTADFANALSGDFQLTRILPGELPAHVKNVDILIVADPQQPFEEKDKFYIDQFVMQGGKVMWLIDPVKVSLDSLSNGYQTYAFPRDLNLSDLFFRYGVRLNYELLQDVYCARIQVNTALPGNTPKFTIHPWYYSPLLVPSDAHPATRNLNNVFSEFASSIDTISGNPGAKKNFILTTSPSARRVKSPSSVSLQNINNPPARELFNEAFIPVGVMLEGTFISVFQNRMLEAFGIPASENIINKSKPTKMVVIADGDLMANRVNYSTNPPRFTELGFDRVSGRTFGNKEFLLNLIYYLNDDQGIMQLRNRTVKMRMLDKVQLREEKTKWQWLNIVLPLVLVTIFGLAYNYLRRRRFNRL
ncbi:gliding motility-associated ABC transporter substrate-binding protein GldG [Maribellus maritimus]|uniref:gliding motility-associated ABC transporter substrate-binding protein GldG n=1 Tax=Maribellus maritimus TaxID=2870838 RepID=UPI001EE9F850|nr:gliding motility-associated ABC transporter substrate-binding protein GldG [Maribellus maritimus]MCG6188853.1 gliding motility-associated ABC transporter substrate-binding protein GldG [Maribellus maritimus]